MPRGRKQINTFRFVEDLMRSNTFFRFFAVKIYHPYIDVGQNTLSVFLSNNFILIEKLRKDIH